mmetsp:Transcript_30750/g.60963  ORF Transcript_30750/g.60963 Transcript_30750/m.60963 type:complete len:256 (+) Transcript_30750:987-1754(+)
MASWPGSPLATASRAGRDSRGSGSDLLGPVPSQTRRNPYGAEPSPTSAFLMTEHTRHVRSPLTVVGSTTVAVRSNSSFIWPRENCLSLSIWPPASASVVAAHAQSFLTLSASLSAKEKLSLAVEKNVHPSSAPFSPLTLAASASASAVPAGGRDRTTNDDALFVTSWTTASCSTASAFLSSHLGGGRHVCTPTLWHLRTSPALRATGRRAGSELNAFRTTASAAPSSHDSSKRDRLTHHSPRIVMRGGLTLRTTA